MPSILTRWCFWMISLTTNITYKNIQEHDIISGFWTQNTNLIYFDKFLDSKKKGFLSSPHFSNGNLVGTEGDKPAPQCHVSIRGNNRHSQQIIHHRCSLMKGLSYWVLYFKGRGWHWQRLDILDSPEQFSGSLGFEAAKAAPANISCEKSRLRCSS